MIGLIGITIAVLCLEYLQRKKWNSQKRKEELASWVKAAVQKRDEKQHVCLDESKQPEDENITFYSAKETQRLVSAGKISAMENLKILAARCHRLGRNNANDTGVNAITEEFYDEVSKGHLVM